jgi:hypothetical protein
MRLTRNIDSKAIEKNSPHSNDLIKSVFITNFHSGGALASLLFYGFSTPEFQEIAETASPG